MGRKGPQWHFPSLPLQLKGNWAGLTLQFRLIPFTSGFLKTLEG